MKTKTPAQIFAQWQRIAKNADSPRNIERAKAAATTARIYWENIYNANGIDRYGNNTAEINHLWEHAATTANIYTNNTK